MRCSHAVGELYPGLLRHLSTLPDRALVDWLERRLGIARLPVVPDTRGRGAQRPIRSGCPSSSPAGTALRGGRDAAGNERRYVDDRDADRPRDRGPRCPLVPSSTPGPAGESNERVDGPVDCRSSRSPAGPRSSTPRRHLTDVIAFEGGEPERAAPVRWGRQETCRPGFVWRYSTRDGLEEPLVTTAQTQGGRRPPADRLVRAARRTIRSGVPFIRVALPRAAVSATARSTFRSTTGDCRGRRARRREARRRASTTTASSTSRRSSSRSGRWRSAATASTSRARRRSRSRSGR